VAELLKPSKPSSYSGRISVAASTNRLFFHLVVWVAVPYVADRHEADHMCTSAYINKNVGDV
jgi:hypothetical protein